MLLESPTRDVGLLSRWIRGDSEWGFGVGFLNFHEFSYVFGGPRRRHGEQWDVGGAGCPTVKIGTESSCRTWEQAGFLNQLFDKPPSPFVKRATCESWFRFDECTDGTMAAE